MSTRQSLLLSIRKFFKKRNSRSGQAVVEYILITAMVVGIVGGVMFPVFEKKITQYQNTIAQQSSSVISQSEMGIPMGWFMGSAGGNFSASNGGLGGGGGDSGDGSNDGSGSAKGRGGRGGGTGTNFSNNDSSSDSKSSTNKKGGGAGSDEDAAAKAEKSKSSSSNRSGSFETNDNPATKDSAASAQSVDEGKIEAETGSTDAMMKKRMQAQSRPDESSGGGCRNMNLFTILKIIAVIVLILIAGAIALSGSGNKEGG